MDITPLKKQFLEAALLKGKTRILIVPHVPGVQLPAHLMNQDVVPLDLTRSDRRPPIVLLSDCIMTDLSFGGHYFAVTIPWLSIGMIRDCEGSFQAYNTPELNEAAMKSGTDTVEPEPVRTLQRIEGGSEFTPSRTGHLKLVS